MLRVIFYTLAVLLTFPAFSQKQEDLYFIPSFLNSTTIQAVKVSL